MEPIEYGDQFTDEEEKRIRRELEIYRKHIYEEDVKRREKEVIIKEE